MGVKKFNRDEIKNHSPKRLVNSVKFAVQGIKYAFEREQNMTFQVLISIVVLLVGLIIGLNRIEWILTLLLMGLVMGAELINTSMEAMLDVMKPEIDPIVKIAKDTSAAAVLLFCIMAGIIGTLIFVPNIINYIERVIP
jgi:diacylglycerol kinase